MLSSSKDLKNFTFPFLFSCRSVLKVPKKTTLYVKWIEMEIKNPKVDKCERDYLLIKGPDGAKIYCGELNGS